MEEEEEEEKEGEVFWSAGLTVSRERLTRTNECCRVGHTV